MKVRITSPDGDGHFLSGSAAHIFLDGVDVSRFVNKVVLTVDAEGPISAEVTVYASEVDVDVSAIVETVKRGELVSPA